MQSDAVEPGIFRRISGAFFCVRTCMKIRPYREGNVCVLVRMHTKKSSRVCYQFYDILLLLLMLLSLFSFHTIFIFTDGKRLYQHAYTL